MNPVLVSKNYDRLKAGQRWLETIIGAKMRETSFIRNSPSHKLAAALDIAPADGHSNRDYALSSGLDPILCNRKSLLDLIFKHLRTAPKGIVYAIENDHFHLGLMANAFAEPLMMRFPTNREHLYKNECFDHENGRKSLVGGKLVGPDPSKEIEGIYPAGVAFYATGQAVPYADALSKLQKP
jgi:hypothetical protein